MRKKSFFQKLSIRAKLHLIIMIIIIITLSFTFVGIITKERFILESQIQRELNALALATAYSSTASISFDDKSTALENLKSLHFNSDIIVAALFLEDKSLFIKHDFKSFSLNILLPEEYKYGAIIKDNYIYAYQPVKINSETIGTVVIIAGMFSIDKIINQNFIYTLILFIIVLFITLILGALLQRSISIPLLSLTNLMQQVSIKKNYSLRMPSCNNDAGKNEIYLLSKGFNEMLENISWRDKELNRYQQHLTDIVEQRTAELKKAKLLAEASSQAKSKFLANMTHELRTPMVGVLGMLDLLHETNTDDIQKDYINTAQNSAKMLLEIINEVLDFSKIEAGQLMLEHVKFNIIKTLEKIIITQAEVATKKKLELSFKIDNDVPENFIGDKLRLKQILNNLLSNAIKFTSKGEIKLHVSLQKKQSEDMMILFEIEDTGIGIPTENQAQLFSPFTQADSSTTRKYGGSGLGLSISKKLVELQQGEIGFSSQEQQGSKFWFSLPFKPLEPVLPIPDLNLNILTLINNESILTTVNHYLNYWNINYQAVEAESLLLKLENSTKTKQQIDRIIVDEKNINKKNLQLIKEIKQNPLFEKINFILITKHRGLNVEGISRYMFKPLSRDHVFQAITLQNETVNVKHEKKLYRAKILLVEDNETNQKVVTTILTQLGLQVAIAEHGYRALEKIEQEDFELIFMDCLMPEMDGFEATLKIRKLNNPKRNTPIIALTANATEADRKKCLAVGMNDFISKPFKREQMIEKIETWLHCDDLST